MWALVLQGVWGSGFGFRVPGSEFGFRLRVWGSR